MEESPVHVVVETFLLLLILFAFFGGRKNGKVKFDSKLSEREKKALIAEWSPVSLTPALTPSEERTVSSCKVLTGYTGRTLTTADGMEAINCGNFDFLGMSIRGEVKKASKVRMGEERCEG